MATRRRRIGDRPILSPDGRALLLEILDATEPTITATALENGGDRIARELVTAGLLVPDGYESVVLADDERPVSLSWSPNHGAYGYFSENRGWVTARSDEITLFRVDIPAFVMMLLKPLGARSPKPLGSDDGKTLFWDAGDVRLTQHTYRNPVWFVRCLGDAASWVNLKALARARPPERLRVLLTTTARGRLPTEEFPQHLVMSLEDLLEEGDVLAVSEAAIAAKLTRGTQHQGPLTVEADGRVVCLHGKEFRFPKGHRQPAIMKYLYDRYREGERSVSVAVMAEDIGLPLRARVRDSFRGASGKRVMSELLFEKAGTCGFRL